jgi:hypothetical protein
MKGTNDTILAIVCGNVLYGDAIIPEFLGVSTVPFAAGQQGAEDALLDVAWQAELTAQDFVEKYTGVMVYFYIVRPSGLLSDHGTVELKAVEVRRILGLYAVNGSDLDEADLYPDGEPRPVTLGDMEPFLLPDDLEDIYEPETWD